MSLFSKAAKQLDGFDPKKIKAIISMANTRIRNLESKRANVVKLQQRSIAEKLQEKKYDAARIRVEQCIDTEKSLSGLEALLVQLELVGARVQVLAESKSAPLFGKAGGSNGALALCPLEMKEAVTTVIWASSVLGDSVPELITLRTVFSNKYGKDFVQMSVRNSELSVSEAVVKSFAIVPKSQAECISYLKQIAEKYEVEDFNENLMQEDPNQMEVALGSIGANGNDRLGLGNGEKDVSNGAIINTSSGLSVPRMTTIEDDLDQRLDFIRLH